MSEANQAVTPVAIALFGPVELWVGGERRPAPSARKCQWLLALLALQRGREAPRAWLAGTLWPENSESLRRFYLRRTLAELRRWLGPEAGRLRAPTPHTLCLDLGGAEVDLSAFDDAIARGDPASLERAVALNRGPLVEGCMEAWLLSERAAREEASLQARERLAADADARGAPAEAMLQLRRVVAADPFRESARRALMEVLAANGDTTAAARVYQEFRRLLQRELATEPDPQTTALFHHLCAEASRRVAIRETAPSCPPVSRVPSPEDGVPSPAAPPRRVPRPLSPLVGRTAEVGEIVTCLQQARLVTLTGASGVGKTRLAIQVADAVAADYTHGAWFVDLGTLADPGLVPQTVATVLGVREEAGRPLTPTLQKYLSPRQLLLVLDNCEHLLTGCALLAEALLSAAAHLRLLTTSRQALGLPGEVVWLVPSLSVPPCPEPVGGCPVPSARCPAPQQPVPSPPGTGHRALGTDVLDLLQFDAVRLFVERAQAAVPAFALTEQNAPATVQLCRRLDGIPLAIELAAARVKVLSIEQIAARLDDRFRLLTGGSRTAPPRQQTLRAALDWSYELLAEPERELLRRLCVFAGGFTLEAAEAICAGEAGDENRGSAALERPSEPESRSRSSAALLPDARNADKLLDLLTALVEKSLVWMEERSRAGGAEGASWGPDPGRYRLLETTREYGREQLANSGEAPRVHARHGDWYLQLAERAQPELQGPRQGLWLERLEAEHDDLRAALEWFLGNAPERALRLAGALARFWEARGHLEEGRRRLAAGLERAGPWRRSPIGAAALDGAGVLAVRQGDYGAARALYGESLEIHQQLDDRKGIARSLGHLGRLAYDEGDCPAARALLEESLTIERELGDRAGLATALSHLAHVTYHQGDFEAARALYEESLATGRELGDRARIATALAGLAEIVCRHGEHRSARSLYEESLAIRRALGDRCGVADSLGALGNVATKQGDYAAARSYLEEALAIGRELGDRPLVAGMLDLLGNLARQQKEYREARRLLEECLTLWRALGARTAVMHALGALGHLAREQGEYEQARAFYRESLRLRQEAQDTNALIAALEDFAELAGAVGEWGRMTRLLGAAMALCEATGKPLDPRWRAECDRLIGGARTALGEDAFAAAWAEGQAMGLEQAVDYAMTETESA